MDENEIVDAAADSADPVQTEDVGDDWGAALAEQADVEAENSQPETEADVDTAPAEAVQPDLMKTPQTADFQDLQAEQETPVAGEQNLNMILEIPVTMSMELGRTKISSRNRLQLNQGSVVELDSMAGEPMDVLVNGTLIAHGEVVVVNEKLGIRLTDVISAAERVKKLK